MEGGADIPIIDVGCFFDGGADESAKRSVATQIYDALHNVGFMYIRNAKIPSQQVGHVHPLHPPCCGESLTLAQQHLHNTSFD
jgi:isopenicillin N synthase-like dioxygenase